MATTALPDPASEPARLTIKYAENEDGWVTARVVEYPAAISQGPTRHDAWVNVLNALRDLTHEPTLAEQLAFTIEARLTALGELVGELRSLGDRLIAGAAERGRAAAERSRSTSLH